MIPAFSRKCWKQSNARKNSILLRSFHGQRLMIIAVVFALLLPVLVFPASAAIDYNDLSPNIVVDGDNDIVTISVPSNSLGFYLENTDYGYYDRWTGTSKFSTMLDCYRNYVLYVFAFRYNDSFLDITNIPDETVITFNYSISSTTMSFGFISPKVQTQIWYYANGSYLDKDIITQEKGGGESVRPLYGSFSYDMTMDKPEGAQEAFFRLALLDFCTYETQDFNFSVDSLTLTFSISSLYRLQEQTGKTNEILKAVEQKLEENGQKLDDVIDKIEQNGDKLDDTNDKIDKLPGEIGDEIQGVIDNEKQEAESSGNKFVDQILGALPDPSTEVLSALKGLTDATSYTGTDAVLPVPAIVLPGIDGLFPETVVWQGAELDFAEYMNIIPPALLSLVRSLFTIAIVLFCVYELKGIISYCLTLRENKGG